MNDVVPLLGAAFLTGLLGSTHCLAMCAGISGLFATHATAALPSQWSAALTYNAGRVLGYAMLGAMAGTFGNAVVAAIPAIAGPIRIATGSIITLIGLQVAFDLRWLSLIERSGAAVWQKLAPYAQRLLPVTSLPRALGLGLLWGWLPCGLVYSVLLMAATSVRPRDGALTMLAFGIGTLPAMLATGLGAAGLARIAHRRGTRLGLGLTIVVLGMLTIAMPVTVWLAASHPQHVWIGGP